MASRKPPILPPIAPAAIRAGARAVASAASPKRRAEAIIERLFELDRHTKSDFYEMGLLLRELKKSEYLDALGFEKWETLLQERRIPKRASAYRLVAVVDNVDRETANAIGIERAYQALKYVEAARVPMKPRVFIRPDRKISIAGATYLLKDVKTRLLTAAVDAIRKGIPLEPPRALEKTTRGLAQRLDHLGIEARRVSSQYRGGESEVTIHLPLDQAKKLFALLGR